MTSEQFERWLNYKTGSTHPDPDLVRMVLEEAWRLLHKSHSQPFGGSSLQAARKAFLGRRDLLGTESKRDVDYMTEDEKWKVLA